MNVLKTIFLIGSITIGTACNCQTNGENRMNKDSSNELQAGKSKKSKEITCKLTAPEMQKRRAEVLASMKNKILERKELKDGYKFKFVNTDSVLDEIMSFVKSERLCCDFFTFSILVSDDDGYTWLSITGPKGAKEFIELEMDM